MILALDPEYLKLTKNKKIFNQYECCYRRVLSEDFF